jgi:hypothetical protein
MKAVALIALLAVSCAIGKLTQLVCFGTALSQRSWGAATPSVVSPGADALWLPAGIFHLKTIPTTEMHFVTNIVCSVPLFACRRAVSARTRGAERDQ